MFSISRRHLLSTAVLAAGSVPVLSGEHPRPAGRPDVELTVDEKSGITLRGNPRPYAGYVTFKASTPKAGVKRLRDVTLLRMRKGVTIEKYVEHIQMAFAKDMKTRRAGLKGVFTLAHAYGGAVLSEVSHVEFTVRLSEGTHYLLDFEDAANPDFLKRIRPIHVRGAGRGTHHRAPEHDDLVEIYEKGGFGRYRSSSRLRGGRIKVVNRASQPHEMLIVAVPKGTTSDDLRSYYAEVKKGKWPKSPYSRGPIGVAPLSPGESIIIRPNLPDGEYALASFLSDADTMQSAAQDGTWKLIRIS